MDHRAGDAATHRWLFAMKALRGAQPFGRAYQRHRYRRAMDHFFRHAAVEQPIGTSAIVHRHGVRQRGLAHRRAVEWNQDVVEDRSSSGGADRSDVVRPFQRGRKRHRLLAQAAFQLTH